MEFTGMVFLLIPLAVILVAWFFFAWKRDKNRSEDVADNNERLHTETDPHPSARARREADGH